MPRDALLTLDHVLTELGDDEKPLHRSTFNDWRAKGLAPRCIKLPNGTLRIRQSELDRFIDSCEEVAR